MIKHEIKPSGQPVSAYNIRRYHLHFTWERIVARPGHQIVEYGLDTREVERLIDSTAAFASGGIKVRR